MQVFKWQGMFVLITYVDRCFPSYYPTFSVVHSIICFYVVIFKTLFIQQIIITSTSYFFFLILNGKKLAKLNFYISINIKKVI